MGAVVDVAPLIEGFLRDEREIVRGKKDSERRASADLRKLAAIAPGKLQVVNELLQAALARTDRLATMYRDARWRLMEARALHQPSNANGSIHGEPWDADEYLKTIS